MARLSKIYKDEIRPKLMKDLGYKNQFQAPKIEKIVLNMGVGAAVTDRKKIEAALQDMTMIAGQKPVVTKARKSVAGFKIREGMSLGVKVTLRKNKMYEFLDRLVNIALPRVKDFRGISAKSFDGAGNYNMGLKEQLVFPEIDYDKTDQIRGLDIAIITSAKTNEEAKALLSCFGMPFQK